MFWKSKAAVPLLCALFAVLLLAGLVWNGALTPAAQATVEVEDGDTAETATAVSSGTNEEQLRSRVFVENEVVDVRITIDPQDFEDMLEQASEEVMKTASVEYNGIKVDNIGIRTKGNLSLRSVVNMPDSDRYSFKLSLDEYMSSQHLFGVTKINLNNNFSDASSMREFMTYELAEELGLPVPGHSYVNVYVNGERYGTYLAVEQIGSAYLERYFGSSTGDLYKSEMSGAGGDLQWISDDADDYAALVKKSGGNSDDALIQMLDELNHGTDYESVLDVEAGLQYIALNVAANNTDSYIGQNKHNYYFYDKKGILTILPWDYNLAFGQEGYSSLLIDEPTQGAVAERPLVHHLLEQPEYKEQYYTLLQQAIDKVLAADVFDARVDELYALIAEDVKQDPNAFYTFEQFQDGVEALKAVNASQVNIISEQLEGTRPSSGDGSGSGGGRNPDGMDGGMGMRNNAAAEGNAEDAGGFPGPAAGEGMPPDGAGRPGAGEQGAMDQQGEPGVRGQQGMQGMAPPGMQAGGGRTGFGGPAMENGGTAGSTAEALTAGAALLLLIGGCLMILFFRRNRL
ncbi:CotH kinase family protein [Paenibacillus sp. F411]|uniref:CotH kinase family protein n=1 Tax=Paenibacillus sp. F411 TaxID=2820239 RepID=UPI001AAF691E|nr:CotH kinase family protein [Paenibacillus sp. F411]MBO2944407.1 CotH kinase family protein [Paenibacillus sp. F411]